MQESEGQIERDRGVQRGGLGCTLIAFRAGPDGVLGCALMRFEVRLARRQG